MVLDVNLFIKANVDLAIIIVITIIMLIDID